jgi:hypothetical protein
MRDWLLIRRSDRTAVVLCGLLGVAVPALYGTLSGTPIPVIHDEFSYLLAADTFAQGRLTNPAPPHPEFFEAPHILVTPTYASKYPPAPAIALAIGNAIAGGPIWGVWLGCGLFAAALCWMLQGCGVRGWAFATAVLMVITTGCTTYWAQSYWGGSVAASGGALLFGGLIRVLREERACHGVTMAVGALLLANSRLYEGSVVCLVAFSVLLWRAWGIPSQRMFVVRVVVVAGIVSIPGVLAMAHYNRAVTGHWHRFPYALHVDQYLPRGLFVFSGERTPLRVAPRRVAGFYQKETVSDASPAESVMRAIWALPSALTMTVTSSFGFQTYQERGREPYRGVWLWLVVLVPITLRRSMWICTALMFLILLIEVFARVHLPLYPTLLSPIVLAVWGLLFMAADLDRALKLMIVITVSAVTVAEAAVKWWWSHYSAPVVPLLLAAIAMAGAQTLSRFERPSEGRTLGTALTLSVLLHVSMYAAFPLQTVGQQLTPESLLPLAEQRSHVESRLRNDGRRHLIFVRYAADYPLEFEWVYNTADLEQAPVIFGHDLLEKNHLLATSLPGRVTWLATVSRLGVQLEPLLLGKDR